ncbi:hypothetical protein AB0I81_45835 [Nonomuraea sp. NPDC050404]|uniref:hypothetical protein n=1 Tax=Nonomuraea sp. NPDC050404 TaxID=3155783 RepID=UPI0034050273
MIDEIVQLLDENKIPERERFIIVTPRIKAMLLKSSKFIDASQYGSPDAILNGEIGGLLVSLSR